MSTQPTHPTDQPTPSAPQQPGSEVGATADPYGFGGPWPPYPSDPAILAKTPPVILEAQATFLRDLPKLLKERCGQWVAYFGTERLGFGTTKTALCQECCQRGYEEFLIRRIEPRADFDYISAV